MLVGYARVSSTDQSLEIQLQQLKDAGCEKVFSEKITGTTMARPELEAAMRWVRDGDVLLVTRLDRFARSVADFYKMAEDLRARNVGFTCVLQPMIDTTTTNGRLVTGILMAFAEFENEVRRERQREGIDAAKAKGVYNKNSIHNAKLATAGRYIRQGMTISEAARKTKLHRRTIEKRIMPAIRKERGGPPPEFLAQIGYDPSLPTPTSAAVAVEPDPTPETASRKPGLLGSLFRS